MKTLRQIQVCVVVLALAGFALAMEPNAPGDLKVIVAVSDNPDYIRKWVETRPSDAVTIDRIRSFHPGQVAYIGFIITGFTADSEDRVRLDVDFAIMLPDGSELFAEKSYAHYSSGIGNKRAFVMADPALDLGFDPGDPYGQWVVNATVHDLISKKSARGKETISLEAEDEA